MFVFFTIFFPVGILVTLAFVQIGPIRTKNGDKHKLEAEVHLNLHGIVAVKSATVSLCRLRDCPVFFLSNF